MKRAGLGGAFVLAVAAAGACDSDRSLQNVKSEIEVTGCLTSAADRFVLTQLDSSDNTNTVAPSTETYMLVGDNDEMRRHVGRQVRVAGIADTPDVAIVRESSPAAPNAPMAPETAGTAGSETPPPAAGAGPDAGAAPNAKVSTATETRVEVSELRVRTIADAGGECPR